MEQNSRIILGNFNNSQDLFFPFNQRDDNDYKYYTFLFKDLSGNTNMNIQSSPTSLNNNFWDPFDAKFPDSLSNHFLLSRKIKRDEDEDSENPFKNDRLISDLEEVFKNLLLGRKRLNDTLNELKEEKKKNESELKLKQNYIKDIPKYLESIEKETNKAKKLFNEGKI